jgi:hypothetical protein
MSTNAASVPAEQGTYGTHELGASDLLEDVSHHVNEVLMCVEQGFLIVHQGICCSLDSIIRANECFVLLDELVAIAVKVTDRADQATDKTQKFLDLVDDVREVFEVVEVCIDCGRLV